MIRTVARSTARSFKVSQFARYQSTKINNLPKWNSNTKNTKKISIGLALLLSTTTSYLLFQNDDHYINNDASNENQQSVLVDKNCSEMPLFINKSDNLSSNFTLLGYGTRAVTFLKMKVYGLGIYIESSDSLKIKQILNSKFLKSFYENENENDNSLTHSDHLLKSLKDDQISVILIDNLLLSGIRFTARISPIRNTDFNHLRDGLMKSIKANNKYKEFIKDPNCPENEQIINGLDQLREVLGKRRGTAPKGSILQLEIINGGKLRFTFNSNDGKSSDKFEEIGIVENGIISRLLFLQYLSGSKPLSSETRDRCVDGFLNFV